MFSVQTNMPANDEPVSAKSPSSPVDTQACLPTYPISGTLA